MTRRVEGTTLAGYKCDAVGCDANGVWAPVVCVPYHDLPVDLYRPVVLFRDIHVCNVHWFDIRIDDQLTPAVRRAVREAAANIPAEMSARFDSAAKLNDEDRKAIIEIARVALARFQPKPESKPQAKAEPESRSPDTQIKPKPKASLKETP